MVDYSEFKPLSPELQLSFWFRLQLVKERYFLNALLSTVKEIPVKVISDEAEKYVSNEHRQLVASLGLRDEMLFMLPCVIYKEPQLIGYYRLLYGLSQKELYSGQYGKFKKLEDDGIITKNTAKYIDILCRRFIECAGIFVFELENFGKQDIYDLQLLTVGPQFRGSNNNILGQVATQKTFKVIKDIVSDYIESSTDTEIVIKNALDREVEISFASDPDITVVETFSGSNSKHKLISVEIKGGTDIANIHNRIGEAEKSHQKAKKEGYDKFMTIISVDIDYGQLKSESPTTNHFFNLNKIQDKDSEEYVKFREVISQLLSIK